MADISKIISDTTDETRAEEAKRFMSDLDVATCDTQATKIATTALRILQGLKPLCDDTNKLLAELNLPPVSGFETLMAVSLAHDVLLTRATKGKTDEKRMAMMGHVMAARLRSMQSVEHITEAIDIKDPKPGVTPLSDGGYLYRNGKIVGSL